MISGTSRFKFFRVIVVLGLVIWFVWLITAYPIKFNYHVSPHIIIGALLWFVLLVLIGVSKKRIRDLKASEFKEISWWLAVVYLFFSLVIAATIVMVVKCRVPAFFLLKKHFGDIATQVIGGFVSGAIGFGSAWLINQKQQSNLKREKARELTENLWFEVIHNKIKIQKDLDGSVPFFTKLEANCWNADIASKIAISGRAKGLIINLVDNFALYNTMYQVQTYLLQQNEIPQNVRSRLTMMQDLPKMILDQANNIYAILFGEMVDLGYRSRSEWSYPDTDWENVYRKFKENK